MAQGCQNYEFIPRSWEFLKMMGFFLGIYLFEKDLGINLGNYRHYSVTIVVFFSVALIILTFSN